MERAMLKKISVRSVTLVIKTAIDAQVEEVPPFYFHFFVRKVFPLFQDHDLFS